MGGRDRVTWTRSIAEPAVDRSSLRLLQRGTASATSPIITFGKFNHVNLQWRRHRPFAATLLPHVWDA